MITISSYKILTMSKKTTKENKKSKNVFRKFFHKLSANVLPLAAVGDFGALHCQPSTNVYRSTVLDLTTSAPIAANGC